MRDTLSSDDWPTTMHTVLFHGNEGDERWERGGQETASVMSSSLASGEADDGNWVGRALFGGEGWIFSLGIGFIPYYGLANRRLRPLGHLSTTEPCLGFFFWS